MPDSTSTLTRLPDGSGHLQVQWEAPLGAMRILQMSRDEQIEGLLSGNIPNAPFPQLVDLVIAEAGAGRAVVELDPDDRHLNPIGSVHGGVIGTLLDSAMWCAAQLSLDNKSILSTVNMNVSYIRSVPIERGRIRALADALHVGRRTVTAQARVIDASDKLCAHATASFLRISTGPSHA